VVGTFTPLRTATVSSPCTHYEVAGDSPRRLLYPMKRVRDSILTGIGRPSSVGGRTTGAIEWDEALEIVAGEIRRMKRDYGPGAIAIAQPRITNGATSTTG